MADDKNKDTGKPDPAVTEPEKKALDGEAGPGRVPAFGKHGGGLDENDPLTDVDQLESVKEGSSASSGSTDPDVAGAIAAFGIEGELPEGAEGSTTYVSSGIQKLKIGRFQFENGRLDLKGDDVGEFENLLAHAHPRTQTAVKKIDREAGEAFAKSFQAQKSKLVRGTDTSETGSKSPEPSKS